MTIPAAAIFLPHRYCMGLNSGLIWLSVITDALVALSYYSIPAALFVLASKRRQFLKFQPILLLFGLFIAFCGGGHAMDIVSLWQPIYWVKAWWNLGTALTSVVTAIVLIPQVIDIVKMPEAKAKLEREKLELQERQSLLNAVLDATMEGVVLTDERGETILFNAAAQNILGGHTSPKVEWRGEDGKPEEAVRLPNGKLVAHMARTVPGYGRLYVLRDLTELRASDQQRLRLERIIRTMSQGFSVISADTQTLISTNPSLEKMFGYGPGKLLGKKYEDLLDGNAEKRQADTENIFGYASRSGLWEGETTNCRADGSTFTAAVSVNLHETDDRPVFSLIQTDVTNSKRLEEESRRLQEKMLQTAKLESVGLLAGGIAHDFNNLLTGIIGNASLVYDQLSPSSKQRMRLNDVIRASERAADLVKQLLAYSGKGQFTVARVRINQLIEETKDLVRLSVPPKVKVDLQLGQELEVEGDAIQIQQVIMNLVINGAEAIPEEREGRLVVRTSFTALTPETIGQVFAEDHLQPGLFAVIEVEDNGTGMDAGTLAQIFDPFFTTKFTGRGLGLAAAQGIARGHAGTIRVYSELGRGTTFRVYLPLSNSAVETIVQGEGLETEAAQTPVTTQRKAGIVIVIDDEESVRELVRNTLEYHGYSVLTAENGQVGLEKFQTVSRAVTLVILDLTMPGMSGEETLKALRGIEPEVTILLSSGFSEREALRGFAGLNVNGFLQKPYTSWKLGQQVHSMTQTPNDFRRLPSE